MLKANDHITDGKNLGVVLSVNSDGTYTIHWHTEMSPISKTVSSEGFGLKVIKTSIGYGIGEK